MNLLSVLFGGKPADWSAPAIGAAAVTVSDTTADAAGPFRGLWVGAAGNVKVTMQNGDAATFVGVPGGMVLPFAVTRVWSTGTTVSSPGTNIIGLK